LTSAAELKCRQAVKFWGASSYLCAMAAFGLVGRGRSAFVIEREDTLLDVCDNCTRMRVSARPGSGREFNGSHDDLVPCNGEVLGDQDLALDRRLLCGDRNERHACRKHGKPECQNAANGDVSHRILLPLSY